MAVSLDFFCDSLRRYYNNLKPRFKIQDMSDYTLTKRIRGMDWPKGEYIYYKDGKWYNHKDMVICISQYMDEYFTY